MKKTLEVKTIKTLPLTANLAVKTAVKAGAGGGTPIIGRHR